MSDWRRNERIDARGSTSSPALFEEVNAWLGSNEQRLVLDGEYFFKNAISYAERWTTKYIRGQLRDVTAVVEGVDTHWVRVTLTKT